MGVKLDGLPVYEKHSWTVHSLLTPSSLIDIHRHFPFLDRQPSGFALPQIDYDI